jgi:glyoxalase family protein
MSAATLLGLHHVTAIAGSPERNVLFYTRTLGLRLVKVTVNFDDPGSYHLYYGSGNGAPGSILTFFPWAAAAPGVRGSGETGIIALAIPAGSSTFWRERLQAEGLTVNEPVGAAGVPVLEFADPDGMVLRLVEAAGLNPTLAWSEGPVSAAQAIHGLHHVVLDLAETEATAQLLEGALGFVRRNTPSADLLRFETGAGGAGSLVKLAPASRRRGRMGPGIVHHIAWRAADDSAQEQWRLTLLAAGLNVTPVQDRQYFHSIYFREPGGVLFEIATDNPGFLIDEPYETLGTELRLPPWLEPHRGQLEKALPKLPPTLSQGRS